MKRKKTWINLSTKISTPCLCSTLFVICAKCKLPTNIQQQFFNIEREFQSPNVWIYSIFRAQQQILFIVYPSVINLGLPLIHNPKPKKLNVFIWQQHLGLILLQRFNNNWKIPSLSTNLPCKHQTERKILLFSSFAKIVSLHRVVLAPLSV